ncbi:MAG: IS6 family transposase [Acidimicrobiales bacterium]
MVRAIGWPVDEDASSAFSVLAISPVGVLWLPVPAGSDLLAVRWYLRYGLSCRDVDELLTERGIEANHVMIYRWVQYFTPLLIDAARPCRQAVCGRRFVDETSVKVAGTWRYVHRAVDQHGPIIDVFLSPRHNEAPARRYFASALLAHAEPNEVVTDLAQALETVIEELVPDAFHNTEQ